MQVNEKKTQMLCINSCVHNRATYFISTTDGEINSSNELKILSFVFDSRPNANKHVDQLIEKFYQKLWTVRFLRRSGIKQDDLLALYNCSVRAAVEYCSVVYHSMIPAYLSNKLEAIQRQALKIIYGWETNIEELMKIKGIETLYERREKAVINFALKNEHVGKYGKKWFKEEELPQRMLRESKNKYKIPVGRTNRTTANPITHMAIKLNEYYDV